jgi:hypothetical protein
LNAVTETVVSAAGLVVMTKFCVTTV